MLCGCEEPRGEKAQLRIRHRAAQCGNRAPVTRNDNRGAPTRGSLAE